MSATLVNILIRCDWCGIGAQLLPMPASGNLVENLPDGWAGIGYGTVTVDPYFRVRLADYQGAEIRHLCPDCKQRPVSELLEHLSLIAGQVVT